MTSESQTGVEDDLPSDLPALARAPWLEVIQGGAGEPTSPVLHCETMLPNRTQRLTVRELAVLELLARGFSHQEITTTLCFSWRTVAKYTNTLYQKLRVTGRRDTVERAAALGIVLSGLGTDGAA